LDRNLSFRLESRNCRGIQYSPIEIIANELEHQVARSVAITPRTASAAPTVMAGVAALDVEYRTEPVDASGRRVRRHPLGVEDGVTQIELGLFTLRKGAPWMRWMRVLLNDDPYCPSSVGPSRGCPDTRSNETKGKERDCFQCASTVTGVMATATEASVEPLN
jgi:hypothetical protein